jgi:hypothetical protein
MLELRELLLGAAVPIGVSTVIALLAVWRRLTWAMPLAAAAAFLTAYYLLSGVPGLPPRDGTDWLFWSAPALAVLGVIDGATRSRWGWALAALAAGVVFLITRPLTPHAVPASTLWITAAAAAVLAPALCLAVHTAAQRITAPAALGCLCITLGAAAVVVLSSNLRIGGVYAMAGAAALGPVAVLSFRTPYAPRAVAIYAIPLLMGMLACGYHYPDPGVPLYAVIALCLAPLIMLGAAFLPLKKPLARAAVALLATALAAGVVAGPAALAAKQAAEELEYTY